MPENALVCVPPLPALQRQGCSGAVATFILAVLGMDISSMTCAKVGMKNICLSFQIKWFWPVFLYRAACGMALHPVGLKPLPAPQEQPPCCQHPHLRGLQSPAEGPPVSIQGHQRSPAWSPCGWWQDDDTQERGL